MKRKIRRVPYNFLHWKSLELELELYKEDKDIYHVEALRKLSECIVQIHKDGYYGEWWMEIDVDEFNRIFNKIVADARGEEV